MKSLFLSLARELNSWGEFIVCTWPTNFIGEKLRQHYWSKWVGGKNHTMLRLAKIHMPELVDIGDNFALGEAAVIDPCESKGIFIGDNVAIAQGAFIRAANHSISKLDIPIRNQGHECSIIGFNGKEYSIIIEDDVWIGAHAIILSGSWLGKGSVVAAGAVVASVVPPYSIVAGNPGRVIGNRQKQSILKMREALPVD